MVAAETLTVFYTIYCVSVHTIMFTVTLYNNDNTCLSSLRKHEFVLETISGRISLWYWITLFPRAKCRTVVKCIQRKKVKDFWGKNPYLKQFRQHTIWLYRQMTDVKMIRLSKVEQIVAMCVFIYTLMHQSFSSQMNCTFYRYTHVSDNFV